MQHRGNGVFTSVVMIIKDLEDFHELTEIHQVLESKEVSYELIGIVNSIEVFRHITLSEYVANNRNIGLYHVRSSRDEDLISYGVEIALGEETIELNVKGGRSKDLINLLEFSEASLSEAIQVLPSRILFRDRAISWIASRSLNLDILTLSLTSRLSSRKSLEVWNRRRMKQKVFRLAPQISGVDVEYIPSNNTMKVSEKRLARVGIRTVFHSTGTPLRWVSFFCLFAGFVSFILSFWILSLGLANSSVEGWATTNLQISVFAFFAFIAISILSEYLYQVFENLNETPNVSLISEILSNDYSFRNAPNINELKSKSLNE